MKGKIKFYNRDKRFGFITGEDEKDYFFHQSGLEEGVSVRDEDQVTFEVVEGDRGPKAEKIKLLEGAEEEEEPAEEEAPEEVEEEIEEEVIEE